MIKLTSLDGRPTYIVYLNLAFELVDEEYADFMKIVYIDAEGGVVFVTR